ncbi:MAG: hypothetical protein HY319_31735 [Armatimonadetes bacterium]|nr:hypothetical protein [Armatimonadota bacterium]
MHLPGDPRENESLGDAETRLRFYVDLLDHSYEAAVQGLMKEFSCSREQAVQRLAESFQRRDAEKLEGMRRAAALLRRAG